MPSTTAYPGTIAALDAITAANNNRIPGGLVGYVSSAANYQMTTSAFTDVPGMAVSFTANASRVYLIFASVLYQCDVPYSFTTESQVLITDGANTVLEQMYLRPPVGVSGGQVCPLNHTRFCVWLPSSGSQTIKLRAAAGDGGTHTLDTLGTRPTRLVVLDVGAAF